MPTTSRQSRSKHAHRKTAVSPQIQAERQSVLKALKTVVELMGSMIGPNVEIVLHDLSIPETSVVAITNGHVSKRSVGQSILSGPHIEGGFDNIVAAVSERGSTEHSIVPNYTTITDGGHRLRSAAATFRDSQGDPFAVLSLNGDMAVVEMAHTWLERMLNGQREEAAPLSAPAPEMDTLARGIITEAISLLGKPLSLMNKEDKVHAVSGMMERGLFMVKGGVEKAAAALGVTRFTIYNYLEELRVRNGDSVFAPVNKQKKQKQKSAQSPADNATKVSKRKP